MSWINLHILLYGAGLAAIPVILHLLQRAKPKKLLFPALRLIQVRRKTNSRRMRLRHIWLLMLRVLVILLLVLAIARPSVPAANYSPTTGETLTLLAIVALAAGGYAAMVWLWRRQRLPNHDFTYRRSLLRGGAGTAAMVLLLLLVAWPYQRRIAAELTGPRPEAARHLPVASVFLFDTSLSMEYRQEGKTRLERAQEIASERLANLPPQSRAAVADSSANTEILFQADPTSAQARIDALQVRPASVPLNQRVRTALALQEDDHRRTLDEQTSVPVDQRKDRFLREIYLFTDLSRSGWRLDAAKFLRDEMARLPWVHVYLIDVGVENPTNIAVSALRLSRQTVGEGGEVIVQATLEAVGVEDVSRTVELHVKNDSGQLVKRGESRVTVGSGTGTKVEFALPGLKGPVVQGEVRLLSSDPLPADDVRHFTVAVRPRPNILLVGETRDDIWLWQQALAPTFMVQQGRARYQVRYLPASRLAAADLGRYESVCLINVRSPSERALENLGRYVESGGGLAVFFGNARIDPVAWNRPAGQAFLPGELLAHSRFSPPEYLDLQNLTHPMLRKFDELGGAGELSAAEVRRYWRVEPAEGAAVLAPYTDSRQSPALLERPHGQGRTLLLTTAVDQGGWSDLHLTRWSLLALADQMMQYLGRRAESIYNYAAGDQATVRLDREQSVRRYMLRKPGFRQTPGEVRSGADAIVLDDTGQAGHYEIVGDEDGPSFRSGFSVNPAEGESDFTRLATSELDTLFGKKRYSLAREVGELEMVVREFQLGQELFPFVLALMMFVFCAEHLVANRFYEADQSPVHV